jgi:tetratricopeptide (TPR) repeat protein
MTCAQDLTFLRLLPRRFSKNLANCAFERGDLDKALEIVQRATHAARRALTTGAEAVQDFNDALRFEAHILESLGRLDEAMAVDAEWAALKPGEAHPGVFVRRAMRHIAEGEDSVAERLLRRLMPVVPADWEDESFNMNFTSSLIESTFRPHTMLAELLERKGTGEALVEARMLRDKVAEQLSRYEAMRAAALEETRAGAAEAVRQWRGERIKAREATRRGKSKGKGKKRKGRRARGKGPSSAPAIEGEPPHEPAGEELERAAAEEEGGPAAAGAEQQAPEGESAPPDDEEEVEEGGVRYLPARPGARGR